MDEDVEINTQKVNNVGEETYLTNALISNATTTK